jgi:uncharacterized protein
MVNKIFVNVPVSDLPASMEFFSRLGFSFNEKFTDENAACMMVGENIFVMLLVESFFQTFTKKEIADTTKTTEVIMSLSVESSDAVDELLERALEAGALEIREAQDQNFMYERSFEDLDGHIWEVFFMDETAVANDSQ